MVNINSGQLYIRVRVADSISLKLFNLVLENVVKTLLWETKDINIDGSHLSHLRFADNIVLISNNIQETREILKELHTSEHICLKMNISKRKVMNKRLTGMV